MGFISRFNNWAAVALFLPCLVQAQPALEVSQPVRAALEEAPADVSAATLSAVALLRGLADVRPLKPVEFATGAAERLRDPHTRFGGFDFKGFRLSYLGPSASGKPGRRIAGTLVFSDAAGRRAESAYALDYRFTSDGLLVEDAALSRQTPAGPRVGLYLVPASRLPADFFDRMRTFGETVALLSAAREEKPSAPFYAIALGFDRLAETDRLVFAAQPLIPQSLRNMGGWQMLASRFDQVPATPMIVRVELQGSRKGDNNELARLSLPGR